ncbi:MAG TPA: ABC transporter substrate-binding protein [bacterium]|nr:ABC transporter substrate-binding protein [bacterium]
MMGRYCRLAGAVAVLILFTAAVSAPALPAPVQGGTLTMAWEGDQEPANMDSQVDPYDSTKLLNAWVGDPLIQLDASGKYIPMLARGWTVSADGKVWTLTLRTGLKFQDGTPFNASAVKFNIDRVMNPDTHSAELANFLGANYFERVDVINASTVKIYYKAPVPILLWGLSVAPMWSPAAVKQYGANYPQHLVGIGAFKLTEWVRGDHLKYVKDPNYTSGPPWQRHTGPAYLDAMVVRFVGDPGVLGQVLKSGEVNLVVGLPSQSLSDYQHNSAFQVIPGYQPGTGMQFVMNTSRPALHDIRVRQALRYAYDPNRINTTLYGGNYVTVAGPLTKYSRFYWPGAEHAYPYNPTKAKALLDEAGWKVNPATGIREKDGQPLTFTIVMLHHQEIGEYLAAQFRNVGVDLKVVRVPGPVQLQRAQSGDFDFIYERQRTFEPDGSLFAIWYSKNNQPGGWAWSRFQNDRLDAVLLATQHAASQDQRQKLWMQVQQMLTSYALALPTVDDAVYYAMQSSVKGFRLGAIGDWFFVNDIYIQK